MQHDAVRSHIFRLHTLKVAADFFVVLLISPSSRTSPSIMLPCLGTTQEALEGWGEALLR